jgi:DNA-binding CsgD family transcriptional regulator
MPKVVEHTRGMALSPMELKCLRGILEGKSYKELADELGNQPGTIATHIMWVRRKWGVTQASHGALLVEYIRRREVILARALLLITTTCCPGRAATDKEWDTWRMQCASVLAENDQLNRLL